MSDDIDIIEDIGREQQKEADERTMNFVWDHRGMIMIITCVVMMAGIAFICMNLEIVKRNPVQYCKKLFVDNGCQYACDTILVFGNESEQFNSLHVGQIDIGGFNESRSDNQSS